ncbi:MAG: DinB family protein [Gemmatimonadaceae bacterium]|nr:DinB family protein [Gemmatimonadaceae bacterium]
MLPPLQSLVAHLRWADRRTVESYHTLEHGHGEALRWIGHIAGSEHGWLSRIAGTEPRVAVWPALDIGACLELLKINHDAFDRLLEASSETDLERVVRYVNSKGDTFDSRVGDIVVHVGMHAQYHRGQVAAAVRAAGGEPVATDYIVWKRGNPVA